jgi:hypothetical protein
MGAATATSAETRREGAKAATTIANTVSNPSSTKVTTAAPRGQGKDSKRGLRLP